MSDYCGTIYSFEVPNEAGHMERWSVFYDVDERMFVAEWMDKTAGGADWHDRAEGAATADELQTRVHGCIPEEILGRLKDSTANGQRVITLTFNEDDGARIFGAPRDEDTVELLTTNCWHWSEVDRSWSVPRSRDTAAKTLLIDNTARWLRDSGHHVTVRVEGRQNEPTHRS